MEDIKCISDESTIAVYGSESKRVENILIFLAGVAASLQDDFLWSTLLELLPLVVPSQIAPGLVFLANTICKK